MTINNDIDTIVKVTNSISPQTVATSTTVNGTAVDLRTLPTAKGHEAAVMAVVTVGSRTDGTFTFALADSADNSTFAAVTLLSGTVGAISAANTVGVGSYIPVAGRPFVRVQVVSTAVTSGGIVSAQILSVPPVA